MKRYALEHEEDSALRQQTKNQPGMRTPVSSICLADAAGQPVKGIRVTLTAP